MIKSRIFLFFLVSFYALISENTANAQYSRSITATKTYSADGTFTITDLADIPGFDPTNEIFALAEVELLIVGGGGGGGRGNSAGGGGGGEVISRRIDLNLGATLDIRILPGGAGARKAGNINSNNGRDGGNSSVKLTSGSTSIAYDARGGQGGSGNGNGGSNGNGNAGGNGNGSGQNAKGGGGGGSGGTGTGGTGNGGGSTGGNGGNGTLSTIGGGYFGAGGGGNGRNGGSAGSGGTGDANPSGQGGNASANSGSGGGAGSSSSSGGNGSNGIVVVSITYRILPVQFLYFTTTYQPEKKSSLLEWATAKEWENSHFEIERAVNSLKTWENIERIEGNGYSDSPVEYSFTDTDLPLLGENVFYRLKQVDFSGKYSYSDTRAIKTEDFSDSKSVWIAYPNPSSLGSDIKLALLDPTFYHDEKIKITLADVLGQGVVIEASSIIEISGIVSNWLKNQNSGIYFLTISWGSQTQQLKLLRD